MRERCVCPKCQHNHILFIGEVPELDENGIHPAMIAVTLLRGAGWFGGDQLGTAGRLQACVCRRCGFTEFYTLGPQTIPIDGKLVRELVGPEPEGPYR
jgi:hypothetical protein